MSVIYPETITDILGNSLPVTRTYEDGSFNCPHCGYAVVAPALECSNPWCAAHPEMPLKAAERIVLEKRKAAEERAARERNLRLARERIEEERAAREADWAEVRAEVERRGACLRCAAKTFEMGRVRIVRHRKACPRGK